MRARDLGIVIGTLPAGPNNAITDVDGVSVGHTTLIEGDGPLQVGRGPVRTGVTVVVPNPGSMWKQPLFAGSHRLNGNGELTGLEWVRESGTLTSPIAITNTHSLGVVRDALVSAEIGDRGSNTVYWSLPVVGETWDGTLNDINGMHVKPQHVFEAFESASTGPVAEGNVGGGTGMICHDFKGGIGTSSRVLAPEAGGYTVGVLVQSNYGVRERLSIAGVPVGREIPVEEIPAPEEPSISEAGSIIIVAATDAPLLPHQCEALAQRAGLGVARMGGAGGHSSGDLFIAFAVGNRGLIGYKEDDPELTTSIRMLANRHLTPLFEAVIEATEEAITNALVAAETMVGRDGATAHALPHDRLVEVMAKYRPVGG
ncbi:MAG TPA: P1 family peptidase [Actinomycetota bacterium]|jgi:D-aminopeptidase